MARPVRTGGVAFADGLLTMIMLAVAGETCPWCTEAEERRVTMPYHGNALRSAIICYAVQRSHAQAWRRDVLSSLNDRPRSAQELVGCDRELANADSGGMIDGIVDGRGGTDDAKFAETLGSHRVDVRVLFI